MKQSRRCRKLLELQKKRFARLFITLVLIRLEVLITNYVMFIHLYQRRHKLMQLWNLTYDKRLDRKSTRLNSTHVAISYAVFCLKKKKDLTFTYLSCS